MLFDKSPGESLEESERAREARLREAEEARERWNRELEEGRRLRQNRQAVKAEIQLQGTPPGRAKSARESGATVFQVVLPLMSGTSPAHPLLGTTVTDDSPSDHNPVLNAIEAQGWVLQHASYVHRTTGSVSRDKAASASQEAAPGEILAVYIFRRRD
jgi:hypothetical protein